MLPLTRFRRFQPRTGSRMNDLDGTRPCRRSGSTGRIGHVTVDFAGSAARSVAGAAAGCWAKCRNKGKCQHAQQKRNRAFHFLLLGSSANVAARGLQQKLQSSTSMATPRRPSTRMCTQAPTGKHTTRCRCRLKRCIGARSTLSKYDAQLAVSRRTQVKSNRPSDTRPSAVRAIPAACESPVTPQRVRHKYPASPLLSTVVSPAGPSCGAASHAYNECMAITIRAATAADVPADSGVYSRPGRL